MTMELALSLPSAMLYPDWIATGRALANSKRNIDWLIGDWLSFGRVHFPEQIEMAIADLGEDPKRIKRIETTVTAFPPSRRDASLRPRRRQNALAFRFRQRPNIPAKRAR